MIELAVQLLFIADLHPRQPLGAQAVDAIDPVAGAKVEGAVTVHVVREVDAQTQVIGAAALGPGADHQGALLTFVHHAVLHLIKVIQAVQCAHVPLQAREIQRFTDRLADVIADH